MVVNRSEIKKKRREGDGVDDAADGSPKRTKVHAQRKFAQGSSSISSIALTPVKDRDKLKTNGTIVSSELIPLKRPKTEDFLTFLCFRGSTILPPSLNFFNVATFHDSQDDESCVPVRDRSPNPVIDLTSVGHKLQQVLKIGQVSNDYNVDETKRNDVTKQRASAVQAIRRKYQGQRLAKQRANTLQKTTQEVHDKSMVITRSSSVREESRLGFGIYQSKTTVIRKCVEKDEKIPKPLETLEFHPLQRSSSALRRHKLQDLECPSKRRCGLRSSALVPLRTKKSVDSGHNSRQSSKQSNEKSFISSLSDFSSDDDQPLAKSAPLAPISKKDLAAKVTKRIVKKTGQIQTRILTRSRVQQQNEHEDIQPRVQQKWSSREVGFHQQIQGKNVNNRLHYLYRHRRLLESGRMKQPLHVQLKRLLPVSSQDQRVPPQVATRFSSRSTRSKETSTVYLELLRNKSSGNSDVVKSCSADNCDKIFTSKKKDTQKTEAKPLERKDEVTQQNVSVKTQKHICDQKLGVQKNSLSTRQKLFQVDSKKAVQARKNIPKQRKEAPSLKSAANDVPKTVTSALRKRSNDAPVNMKGNARKADVKQCLGSDSATLREEGKEKGKKQKGKVNPPHLIGKTKKCENKLSLGLSKGHCVSEPISSLSRTPKRVSQRKKVNSDASCCERIDKESEPVDISSTVTLSRVENSELRKKSKTASKVVELTSNLKSAHQKNLRRSLRNVLQSSCVLPDLLISNVKLQRISTFKHTATPNPHKHLNPQKHVFNSSESKFNDSDEEPLKKIALKNTSKQCPNINKQNRKGSKSCNSVQNTENQNLNETSPNLSKTKEKFKKDSKGTSSNMSSVKDSSSKCEKKNHVDDQRNIVKRKGINSTKIAKAVDSNSSKRISIEERLDLLEKEIPKNIKHGVKVRSKLSSITTEISKGKERMEKKLHISTKCTKVTANFSKSCIPKGKSLNKHVIKRKVTNPSIVTELFPCSRHQKFRNLPTVAGSRDTIVGKKKTRIKSSDETSKSNEEVLRNLLKQFSESDITNECSKNDTSADNFDVAELINETDGGAPAEVFLPQCSNAESHEKSIGFFKENLFEKYVKKCPSKFSRKELGSKCEELVYENCPNVSDSDLQDMLQMTVLKEDACYIDCRINEGDDGARESTTLIPKKCVVKQKKINLPNMGEVNSEINEETLSQDVAHFNLEESALSSKQNRAITSSTCFSGGKMAVQSSRNKDNNESENDPVSAVKMSGDVTVSRDILHATDSHVKRNLVFDSPESLHSSDAMKFSNAPQNKNSLFGTECYANSRTIEKENDIAKRDSDLVEHEDTDDDICKKLICNENVKVDDSLQVSEAQKDFLNNDQDLNCFSTASNEKSDKCILKYFDSDYVTKNPSAAKMSTNINGEKPFLGSDVSSSEFPDIQPVRSKQLVNAEIINDNVNIGESNTNLNNLLDDVEKDCIAHNPILPSDLGLQDLKVKEKLNMSAERVEKWLSENCSGNLVHKKDCTLFEKNICCCGFSVSDDDLCSPYAIDKFSLCDDSGECEEETGLKSQFVFGFTNDFEVNKKGSSSFDKDSKPSKFHPTGKDNLNSEKDVSNTVETLQTTGKEDVINEEKVDQPTDFDLNSSCPHYSSLSDKRNLLPEINTSEKAHEGTNVSSSQACEVDVAEGNLLSSSDPSPSKIPTTPVVVESKIHISPDKMSREVNSDTNKNQGVSSRQTDVDGFNLKTKKICKPSSYSTGRTKGTIEGFSEKKSIFRNRRFPLKIVKQKDHTPSANAFSPDNESSVYAFEAESEVSPSTPFRRHTRDSRTSSSTTKSEEDITKFAEDETSCADYNSPPAPCAPQGKLRNSLANNSLNSDTKEPDVVKFCSRACSSIAVQVNLDSGANSDASSHCIISTNDLVPEPFSQRTMECSTQTEGVEEDEGESEDNLLFIPVERAETPTQQFIQGVTVKLGSESVSDSNQKVVLRAQFVKEPTLFGRGKGEQEESPKIRPVVGAKSRCSSGSALQNSIASGSSTNDLSESPVKSSLTSVGSADNASKEFVISSPLRSRDNEYSAPENNIVQKCHRTIKSSEPVASSMKPALVKQQKVKSIQNSGSSGSSNLIQNTDFVKHGDDTKFPSEKDSPTSKTGIGFSKKSLPRGKMYKASDNKYSFFPTNVSIFPTVNSPGQLVEAPVFYPTDKEFQDPLEYIDKIKPLAETFGLCRIVPPPNFKPECKVSDDMRFTAYNQYVHKMLHRWGPNAKEMMAIRKYLNTQNIPFVHPPLIGGMEVDLPRLYQTVQTFGGLKRVIEKKRWHKVADSMKIPKSAQDRVAKLDDIYCKYLLPYDTLSPDERRKLLDSVEEEWQQRQKKPLTQDGSASSDNQDDEIDIADEECIVKGRSMPLNAFYRIARNTMAMWFRLPEPSSSEVEQEFWNHVMSRTCHVCVHSGSIDSSGCGYGFPCSKNSPFARHPWNLKVLTNNSGSVLRSIGPIMGITVPTLHVGMLFSTCCWYRDPHGLPWIEYLHTGAKKIWYGIPDSFSYLFRSAMNDMIPRYCKSKTIWLPSDTAMVPPSLLVKHGVSLCHTVQEPGQFIVVFPRAFTSSICTGYLVSESVYFAQPRWLLRAEEVFKDIRNSCEPSVFSLERLLISIAEDPRSHVDVLKQVLPMIMSIRDRELEQRKVLYNLGLKALERLPLPEANVKRRKIRQAQEEEGDYECEICRANLFISLVINSHEEGVYCLEHAIDLITSKRHHLKYCKLMYTYDQVELRGLITKLQEKIDVKSQRKSSHGKHSLCSTK